MNLSSKKDNKDKKEIIEVTYTQRAFTGWILEPMFKGGFMKIKGTDPNKWEYEHSYELEDAIFIGVIDGATERGALLIGSPRGLYRTAEELLENIIKFSRKWVDLPEDDRFLSSAYVLLSYVQDWFPALPFLRFRGDTGTGKTRALNVFGALCYKVLCAGGSATPAAMRRLLDRWRGSLAVDESDFHGDERDELNKMLCARNEKGFFSNYMACDKNDPKNIDVLQLFGATVLASRRPFKDKAVESRCITIVMQETKNKKLPVNLDAEFRHELEIIRDNLTMFRCMKLAEDWIPEPLESDDWGAIQNIEPRIRQVFEPLFQILDTEGRNRLIPFIKEHRDRLVSERGESFDGFVLEVLYDLLDARPSDDKIPVGDMTNRLKEYPYEMQKLSGQSVGAALRRLGFNTAPGAHNIRVVDFNGCKKNWETLRSQVKRYLGHELPENYSEFGKPVNIGLTSFEGGSDVNQKLTQTPNNEPGGKKEDV